MTNTVHRSLFTDFSYRNLQNGPRPSERFYPRKLKPKLAGLLTSPFSGNLPILFLGQDSGLFNRKDDTAFADQEFTAAGTVPDSHRIPYYAHKGNQFVTKIRECFDQKKYYNNILAK